MDSEYFDPQKIIAEIQRRLSQVPPGLREEFVMCSQTYAQSVMSWREHANIKNKAMVDKAKQALLKVCVAIRKLPDFQDLDTEPFCSIAADLGVFPSKAAVFKWLVDHGYPLKKSMFYQHCKQGELLRRNGVYHLEEVKAYLKRHLPDDDLALVEREKKARIEYLKARTRDVELAIAVKQGKYVLASEVERMMVAAWLVLDRRMRGEIKKRVSQFVRIVDGDAMKAPLLLAELLAMQEDVFAQAVNSPVTLELARSSTGTEEDEVPADAATPVIALDSEVEHESDITADADL